MLKKRSYSCKILPERSYLLGHKSKIEDIPLARIETTKRPVLVAKNNAFQTNLMHYIVENCVQTLEITRK